MIVFPLGETGKKGDVFILVDGTGSNGTAGKLHKDNKGASYYSGRRFVLGEAGNSGDNVKCTPCNNAMTKIGIPSGGSRGNQLYVDQDEGSIELSKPTTAVAVGNIVTDEYAIMSASNSTES